VSGAEPEELVEDGANDGDEDQHVREPGEEAGPGHYGEEDNVYEDDYEDEGGAASLVGPGEPPGALDLQRLPGLEGVDGLVLGSVVL